MLNPQFCCCGMSPCPHPETPVLISSSVVVLAIPLVNAGIYALLSEQFVRRLVEKRRGKETDTAGGM